MRLETKNKRSCIGLLLVLALLAGAILWMSLGGVSSQTTADDPEGPVDAVPPPPGAQAPPGTAQPPPAGAAP
jgi:hypothetical protein